MRRALLDITRKELRRAIYNDTFYGEDGELRWRRNKQCVPLDIFEDAGVTPPVAQKRIRNKEVAQFLDEYRKANENRKYSEEEVFEMRAAFGEGETVVDIVTGKKVQL